jgi:hypothetical protein
VSLEAQLAERPRCAGREPPRLLMATGSLRGAGEGKIALGNERQQTVLLSDLACLYQILDRCLG